ncbi:dephospho-CoA kinase [Aurantibacter aestuarii]|uniref:Dephospho-CoA kinase n=1 Tax=Aurantibacter aestuarii TaxID=1266046 RepID=A0A2T1N8A9_9FLAO|nr:dephospho-CoA kinase [Aurantibacter aestuarii]PSG88101.1 dephospho-CoA kinase [Aurantibacter aestuarii]
MSVKIIGLTGGIGSGKTTVANCFSTFDIPVYIADLEAKKLMVTSKVLIRQLKQLFGAESYLDKELNRAYIAQKIFSDKDLLEKMNAIVHPKVSRHFKKWLKKQSSKYVIYESALIFENSNTNHFDSIITVTAPLEIRVQRVVERDNSTEKKVKSIISNQLSDKVKIENSDFVIKNLDLKTTKHQVKNIHFQIIELIDSGQI